MIRIKRNAERIFGHHFIEVLTHGKSGRTTYRNLTIQENVCGILHCLLYRELTKLSGGRIYNGG